MFLEMKEGRKEGRKSSYPLRLCFLEFVDVTQNLVLVYLGEKNENKKTQYFLIPTTHTWNQPKEIILFTVYFYIYIFFIHV